MLKNNTFLLDLFEKEKNYVYTFVTVAVFYSFLSEKKIIIVAHYSEKAYAYSMIWK